MPVAVARRLGARNVRTRSSPGCAGNKEFCSKPLLMSISRVTIDSGFGQSGRASSPVSRRRSSTSARSSRTPSSLTREDSHTLRAWVWRSRTRRSTGRRSGCAAPAPDRRLGPEVEPQPGDTVLDGTGRALIPGTVNAHTHAAMTLFRGYADDLPLMEWLERYIWPAEQRLEREDVYWGTRLACLEMARAGTIRFWDHYWKQAETARAVATPDCGRSIGAPLIDDYDPEKTPNCWRRRAARSTRSRRRGRVR